MNRQIYRTLTWITCISALLFIPFLGGIPLFDWDEVNFAEVAREMILTGDYSRPYIDFVPFWEKPPLFFWMQALSMQIWGIHDFAARLPNAFCGIVSLNVLYIIGRRLYDHRFGLLWVLAYGGSLLPHLYFRSGIIDPWFNLFIFTSLYFLFRNSSVQSTLIAGVLLGLAVLTKGPVAFLIVLLVVLSYWILRRFRSDLSVGRFIVYSITAAFVFGTWYGVETIRNGPWFVMEFTRYQWELLIKPGAGHAGFPGYHVVVLLFGCFPASVLAIQPLFRRTGGNELQRKFKLWMCILLLVVLVLFSIVQSKIVHYSSLCYFPLTFLATLYVWDLLQEQGKLGMWQKLGINAIALLFLIAGVLLVGFGQKPVVLSEYVQDVNTRASLTLDVGWSWWHVFPILFLVAFFIVVAGMSRKNTWYAIILMYACSALFVWSGILMWIGKVQRYTQGPATEFFSSITGKDVYAIPWGHKSYSQYWDFRKPRPDAFIATDSTSQHPRYSDPDYLLSVQTEKDVYVITKISKADEFQSRYPHVQKTGEKGGFVFFLRRIGED